MSDKEILTSEYLLDDLNVKLIDGTRIRIGGYHVDFFLKLRKLSNWQILDLMQLDDDDVLDCIEQRKQAYAKILLKYFDKRWKFRETGEEITFELDWLNEEVFGLQLTKKQIISSLNKVDKKINLKKMADMIEIFKEEKEITETE